MTGTDARIAGIEDEDEEETIVSKDKTEAKVWNKKAFLNKPITKFVVGGKLFRFTDVNKEDTRKRFGGIHTNSYAHKNIRLYWFSLSNVWRAEFVQFPGCGIGNTPALALRNLTKETKQRFTESLEILVEVGLRAQKMILAIEGEEKRNEEVERQKKLVTRIM